MIPITAYTEPVASSPNPFISELHENDENENQSDFSEILAAIMKSPEQPASDNEQPAVNSDAFGFEQLAFSNEQLAMSNEQLAAGNEQLTLSSEQLAVSSELESSVHFTDNTELESSIHLSMISGQLAVSNEQLNEEMAANSDLWSEISEFNHSDKDISARLEKSKAQNIEKPAASNELVYAGKEIEEALAADKAAKNTQSDTKQADALSKTEISSINSSEKKSDGENAFSRNGQEEKQGRLEEVRNRSRRDRISFDIRDQRTDSASSRSFVSVEAAASRMAETSVKDITLDLRLGDFNNAGQTAQTSWEVKAASAMENMLARELHQNFNGDIVRHASMALRDSGESIIRLNLKPDVLGNIKIRLEMTDNKVTGIILVESEEALNAFRREIASLEQAFREAGFSDANLDLSLADDGKRAFQESEENNYSTRTASSNYEDSLREGAEAGLGAIDIFGQKTGSLNMFA